MASGRAVDGAAGQAPERPRVHDHIQAFGSEHVSTVGLSLGGHVACLAAQFDLAAVAVFYGEWLPTTDMPLSRPRNTTVIGCCACGGIRWTDGYIPAPRTSPLEDRKLYTMPIRTAVPVVLTASERHRLKKMAYGRKTPHQARQRATVVLLAARGRSNARIAAETRLHVDTVRTWRGRFADGGLPALTDRKRSGRPARFTPVQVAEAKTLACQLPAETGVPLARWSSPELATELTARGITDTVSASTVRRWLRQEALKPWQYRSWIFIRDPDFRTKAARVMDLYARTFDGAPLGEDEYVISAGEKTSIQARCRCHPTLAPDRPG